MARQSSQKRRGHELCLSPKMYPLLPKHTDGLELVITTPSKQSLSHSSASRTPPLSATISIA